jgi:hypothetical protein
MKKGKRSLKNPNHSENKMVAPHPELNNQPIAAEEVNIYIRHRPEGGRVGQQYGLNPY